jgi:hypothetical protein
MKINLYMMLKKIYTYTVIHYSTEITQISTCTNPNKYHSMPDDTDEYSRADYFNDPYNSRDLNPTEPMDHGCGSRRE